MKNAGKYMNKNYECTIEWVSCLIVGG